MQKLKSIWRHIDAYTLHTYNSPATGWHLRQR